MGGSAISHSATCLILSMGSHEPYFNTGDRFIPLGRHVPEAAEARKQLDVREPGLWYLTKKLFEENKVDKLLFPIAQRSILHALEHSSARIDLALIVTGRETKGVCAPDDPRRDDTWFAGKLFESFIRQRSDLEDKIPNIFTVKLCDDPHLYSRAQRSIEKDPFFRDELPKYQAIYVGQSPGLPMVNAAVLRRALRVNRRGVTAFQVEDPGADKVKRGCISEEVVPVPAFDLLSDWAFDLIAQFIARFDYDGALRVLDPLNDPHRVNKIRGKLENAKRRWNLDMTGLGHSHWTMHELVLKLWLACDVVEAQIEIGDLEDALCRAADIVNMVRDVALAVAKGDPNLVLGGPGSIKGTDRDSHNWNFRPPLQPLLGAQERGWEDLRRARNNHVHRFVMANTAHLDMPTLANRLRRQIRDLHCALNLYGPLPDPQPFERTNIELKKLVQG